MASGIALPVGAILSATSQLLTLRSFTSELDQQGVAQAQGPWSPPQWALPALTVMTVTNNGSTATGQPATQAAQQAATTTYAFQNPAAMRVTHRGRLKKTQHPVLTGANISDHAYIEPAIVTIEILASDAMATLSNGVWSGWQTVSISAWQIFKQLRTSRALITLTTRLDTYQNMLITDCVAPDDNKTLHGLRGTITFEEIIAASVVSQTSNASARPNATNTNPAGSVQGATPDPNQVDQHVIPSAAYPSITAPPDPSVPGAGDISSNSLGQLPQD